MRLCVYVCVYISMCICMYKELIITPLPYLCVNVYDMIGYDLNFVNSALALPEL